MLAQASEMSGKWERMSIVPGRKEFVVLLLLMDGKLNRKFKSKDWDFLSVESSQRKLVMKVQKSNVLHIYISTYVS